MRSIGSEDPSFHRHTTGEIFQGTFDAGDYTFAGDLNVTGNVQVLGAVSGGSPLKVGVGIQIIPPVSSPACNDGVVFFNSSLDKVQLCKNGVFYDYTGSPGATGANGPARALTWCTVEQGSQSCNCGGRTVLGFVSTGSTGYIKIRTPSGDCDQGSGTGLAGCVCG